MYIQSPMEAYNKNNPFVIIAKKRYDIIMDSFSAFSKKAIVIFVAMVIMLIFHISQVTIMHIKGYNITGYLIFISMSIIINISLFLYMRIMLKRYLQKDEAILEFSRLSELTVNQILTISNEDILRCINLLYNMEGKFSIESKVFIILQYTAIIMQLIIGSIIAVLIII